MMMLSQQLQRKQTLIIQADKLPNIEKAEVPHIISRELVRHMYMYLRNR